MKKRHSTANVLLIELVLVILFFMLCTSTIVEMFGHARVKSIYARSGNEAMLTVENLEERLACTADTEGELRKEGFELENGVWVLHRDTFTLTASESSTSKVPGLTSMIRKPGNTGTSTETDAAVTPGKSCGAETVRMSICSSVMTDIHWTGK
jgi:hypothetical protein